ncbi:MAG: AAA-like domain-containing protein [Calothrix sp. MO_167.B42]|nr:AAA-like domain-containing protein [Calothrix sp. MO_167.B42]
MSLNNYYQRGGSLRADADTYVERTADQELLDGLKAGKYCYVLNARQMGKSSLMFRAKHKLEQQGFACATIGLDTLGKDYVTHDAWYKGLFTSLVKKFNLVEKFDRDLWWNQQQESPLTKLLNFVDEILLENIPDTKIVVFFDEIDITLSLHFKVDDFFAFIRACWNLRAENPAYKRLHFALFGVASLSELNTNLNIIGREIKLTGFKLSEIKPLAKGLTNKVKHPKNVLREILYWTGGQPYLTQTICDLVVNSESYIQENEEAEKIARIVKTQLIDNWKSKDPQRHLENIQAHLLKDNSTKVKRLTLYQKIWQQGQIIVDETLETHPEKNELQLAGIVIQEGRVLQVFNRIYQEIFDENWVTKVLTNIRPFANNLSIWLKSKEQDESQLLYGQELQEVLNWAAEKHLSQEDNNFLSKSQTFDAVNRERLSNIPNYEFVIKEVLSWTQGEKQLNDCIFDVAKFYPLPIQGSEPAWVDKLVRRQILDKWHKQIANYSIDDFRYQLLIIHLGKLSMLIEKDKIDIAEVFQKWIPELEKKTSRLYSNLVEQILLWTKPNSLLVEQICQLICDSSANIPANNEAEYIKELVQTQWIRDWESRVDTQPLQDMRDCLLKNQNCEPFRLLIRYRQILRNQVILDDDFPEDTELLNLKIIDKKNGNLSIANLTYKMIFNSTWIDQSIANIWRPYNTKKLLTWLDSQGKDKSQLLVGEELQRTKDWADTNKHSLNQLENNFIIMSILEQF